MPNLTKRQREVLEHLRSHKNDDYEGEIAYEKGVAYLGSDRIASRTLFTLIRLSAVSPNQLSADPGEGVERYSINETGIDLLDGKNV